MTTEIVQFEPQNLNEAMTLATTIAPSALLPAHLRGKPADLLITVMTGRELGLSPMQAIRGMYVVNGKAAISADMMVALCARQRSICRYFMVRESTAERATYETHREGHPEPTRITFTMGEASKAGLLSNATWAKYPAAMLRARAASALARAVYPDLLAGVYEDGEAQEIAAREPAVRPPPVRGVIKDDAPHNHVTGEVVETPEQIRARLLADCARGWLDWTDKRAWSKGNKAAKDSLSPEWQQEVSAAYVAASPVNKPTTAKAPTPPPELPAPTQAEIDAEDARQREAADANVPQ